MAASVDGEAKRVVCAIGRNGVFYASALTALKREFGNPYHIWNSKTFWNLGILSISPDDNKGIILNNGIKNIKTNARLDSGSDTTLISTDVWSKLELNGAKKS